MTSVTNSLMRLFSQRFRTLAPTKYFNKNVSKRFISQSTALPKEKPEYVTLNFIDRDGDSMLAKAKVGENLLTVAIDNDIELEVTLHFLNLNGEKVNVEANVGDNILDVVIDNDIDLDGYGACEGTLACSTCHLIFKQEDYDKIPEKPSDEELDMLDLAFGLEDTSRLGCQVYVRKEMDGWEIKVPDAVADARDV